MDAKRHPAMIFDSGNPTGYDADLGSPNGDFGGPGRGSGGERGQPGENNQALGYVLILSEDGDSSDPDDYHAGGRFIFEFDQPLGVEKAQLLDIDYNESKGKIKAYNLEGDLIGTVGMKPLGNNSVQTLLLGFQQVKRLEVYLQSSGALAALTLCHPDPLPTPVPPEVKLEPLGEIEEGQTVTVEGKVLDEAGSEWSASIKWTEQDEPSTFEISEDGTFSLSHTYGDDGVYRVEVSVENEEGLIGQASLNVTVRNAPPIVTLSDPINTTDCSSLLPLSIGELSEELCREINHSIVRTYTPHTFTAHATDPGSDDLIFRWSFNGDHTYYNDGANSDPNVSPDGTFPFAVTDQATTTFYEPGTVLLTLHVLDDDGGSDKVEFEIEVKRHLECVRGLGFWKHQFGSGRTFFWKFELMRYLSWILDHSRYFAREYPIESIEEAANVLAKFDRTMLDNAEAHLFSAWLNHASGAIAWDERIDTDGDGVADASFGELIESMETTLLDTEYTHDDLEWVKDLAEAINEHRSGDETCLDIPEDLFDDIEQNQGADEGEVEP